MNSSPNTPEVSQNAEGAGNYASFGKRFAAALVDGVLLAVVNSAVGFMFGAAAYSADSPEIASLGSLAGMVIAWVYYVVFTATKGQTLGKMAMKIRVQNLDTAANLTWVEAFLREVVGKFLSAVALLLGYLWMLWDPKKQTWHDKLGKSVVVNVG